MSQQGILPYLNAAGVEVANAARTVEYLRNGLGSGRFDVQAGALCGVLYRTNGGTVGAPETFVSPAADPAPWYDADEPGSATFLGIILRDLRGYDSVRARARAPRGSRRGGAIFGSQTRTERVWDFRATLVAGDDDGAEYGLRWLEAVLASSDCATCDLCTLTVRLACPPASGLDDDLGEWFSYDVALVEGPSDVSANRSGILGDCREIVDVTWKMVAGDPYLYRRPVACGSGPVILGVAGCDEYLAMGGGTPPAGTPVAGATNFAEESALPEPVCCTVDMPARGALSAIYTIESVSGMGPVVLEAYENCPSSGPDEEPFLQMILESIPANSTVVVDSGRETVTVTVAGVDSDGQHLLELPAGRGLEWIVGRDCDTVSCFCARANDPCAGGLDTTVAIATQHREG